MYNTEYVQTTAISNEMHNCYRNGVDNALVLSMINFMVWSLVDFGFSTQEHQDFAHYFATK